MGTMQQVSLSDYSGSFGCFSPGICEAVVDAVSPSIDLALYTIAVHD